MLHEAATDLTDLPLRLRRGRLEALLGHWRPYLQLIARTRSLAEAEDWLDLVPGVEGVVAKRSDSRYLPGQRQWVKVKKVCTADCVVIGIAGDWSQPALVLGLRHADGAFHHFGLGRFAQRMLTAHWSCVLAGWGRAESDSVALAAWRGAGLAARPAHRGL
jgi:ATP-dependent DNA ligase